MVIRIIRSRVFRITIFITFLLLCSHVILAVIQGSDNCQYSSSSGLSNNSITFIFQDSRGFLWVGTEDGLNRFDGYKFKVYRHKAFDSLSISGNFVSSITEDGIGDLWIGTKSNGLNRWSRKNESFSQFAYDSADSCSLPSSEVLWLGFSQDSGLLVKTRGFLSLFVSDSLGFERYEPELDVNKLSFYTINDFNNDSSFLFGAKGGWGLFNKVNEGLKRFWKSESDRHSVLSILPITADSFLIGSSHGLLLFCPEKGVLEQVSIASTSNQKANEAPVSCLISDGCGGAWVGTNIGLRHLDLSVALSLKESLYLENEVTDIFEDQSNILWVGTKYDGLVKLDQKKRKFSFLTSKYLNNKASESHDFLPLFIDSTKKVWFGSSLGGLYGIAIENQKVDHWFLGKEEDIQDDGIISIYNGANDTIWLGTKKGIFLFDMGKEELVEYSYGGDSEYNSLLQNIQVNVIREDHFGNLWFGTQCGLFVYDGVSMRSFFSDELDSTSLCSDIVNDLYVDHDGRIWIGTKEGINIFDPVKNEFIRFANKVGAEKLLCNNWVVSLDQDLNGRLWIGTRSGLSYFDFETETVGFLTQEDGMANDVIHDVVCDSVGRVWVSTNQGITCIKSGGAIKNYDTSDGLPEMVFYPRSGFYSPTGEIFFGGDKGLIYFHPDSMFNNLNKPNVELTSIKVYNKGILKASFPASRKQVQLKYEKNSRIRFEFAVMDFTHPHKNRFRVILEGYDDSWREVSDEPYVDFSALAPGKYTLKVFGSNNDLIWSEEPLVVEVDISPPLWMSNFAYAFYLIAIIFLGQSVINYRIRHYRKAFKGLQEKAVDKKKIEKQKEELSKINKSLTDSIYYAKRIQEAMLPSEDLVRKILPESFIYFRPKDIVSGDFYWVYEKGTKIFVAAVDCTGHGVPGAFMSIIGYDILRNIASVQNEFCPSRMMDMLSREVVAIFRKNKIGNLDVNDGMDMALCVIDKDSRKMEFSGAFNPIYLIRDNEIVSYRGNRFSVGHPETEGEMGFLKHEIILKEDDVLYLFSDGYVDQFGGEEGKKFKYRRFRHLILNVHKLPFQDQKAIFHQKLQEWMGTYEQVDDVVLIGFKPF